MRSQFIRIYLLMIAVVCLLLYSFNAIFQQVSEENTKHYTSINQLFDLQSSGQGQPTFTEIPRGSLVVPERLAERLNEGEIIALELQTGFWTYYQHKADSEKLVAFGPVPAEPVDDDIDNYFLIFFYSALALFFLALLKPLFKELDELLNAAKQFGKKPTLMTLNIGVRSSVYPLAVSFQKMSRQIMGLLTMNRDLSRTIAHELRTPLARIRFVNQALVDVIEPSYFKRIEQDIEEIDQLITAYLNFAKLENKEEIFNKRRRKFSTLMMKIEEKYKIYQGDVMISFNYQNVECSFDAQHMSIALQNLISNAMRYAKTKINVTFTKENNICLLIVSDDGLGLVAEKVDLFDAFVRQQNQKSDKGFGLGLYIARRVAILHSGDLRVENDPELGGARFTLLWPNEN
ncbi:sensor histidine kinase [Colwelliaceae bacterium 6471]